MPNPLPQQEQAPTWKASQQGFPCHYRLHMHVHVLLHLFRALLRGGALGTMTFGAMCPRCPRVPTLTRTRTRGRPFPLRSLRPLPRRRYQVQRKQLRLALTWTFANSIKLRVSVRHARRASGAEAEEKGRSGEVGEWWGDDEYTYVFLCEVTCMVPD